MHFFSVSHKIVSVCFHWTTVVNSAHYLPKPRLFQAWKPNSKNGSDVLLDFAWTSQIEYTVLVWLLWAY